MFILIIERPGLGLGLNVAFNIAQARLTIVVLNVFSYIILGSVLLYFKIAQARLVHVTMIDFK